MSSLHRREGHTEGRCDRSLVRTRTSPRVVHRKCPQHRRLLVSAKNRSFFLTEWSVGVPRLRFGEHHRRELTEQPSFPASRNILKTSSDDGISSEVSSINTLPRYSSFGRIHRFTARFQCRISRLPPTSDRDHTRRVMPVPPRFWRGGSGFARVERSSTDTASQ